MFQKGNTLGKGRPKGSENKETKALREKVHKLLQEEFNTFLEDLKSLKASERVDVFIRLLEYGLPKLSRSEVIIEEDPLDEESIDFSKLSPQTLLELSTLLANPEGHGKE